MKRTAIIGFVLLLVQLPVCVLAQTIVQLPTVRNFGMSTTVSVPDRGRTYLGGINRSYSNSTRRRIPMTPFSSRTVSRGRSSGGVSVSAFVHDFEEMDRAVLSQASKASPSKPNRNIQGVAMNDQHQLPRVSDIRRQVAAQKASQYAKAAGEIRAAVRLENAGEYVAARSKYRGAYATSKPEWQAKIRTRVRKLDARLAQRPKDRTTKL